jgi:hypothetical protein
MEHERDVQFLLLTSLLESFELFLVEANVVWAIFSTYKIKA